MKNIQIKRSIETGPGYYEAIGTREIWIKVGMKLGGFYGNAAIARPEYAKVEMRPGDQIHALPAGIFIIYRSGETFEVKFEKPTGTFEREYFSGDPELPGDIIRQITEDEARTDYVFTKGRI